MIRLLAIGADAATVGLTAACFAVPPIVLAVGLGRWTERHHPAVLFVFGIVVGAVAAFTLAVAEQVWSIAVATTALGIGHTSATIGGQSIMAQAESSIARIGRFGTLTTARHRGMASLGLALTLGVTFCMVAALVWLPAVLRLLDGRKRTQAEPRVLKLDRGRRAA